MSTFRIVDSLIILHLDDGRTLKVDLPEGAWADLLAQYPDMELMDEYGPFRYHRPQVEHQLIVRFGAGTLTIYDAAPIGADTTPFQNPFDSDPPGSGSSG